VYPEIFNIMPSKTTTKAPKKPPKPRGGARKGAGRPKGIPCARVTKERIKAGMLIGKLERIAEGEDHVPSQVTAALGLLRFVMPHAVDVKADVNAELTINLTQFKSGK
jgi:hypothetical protein